MVQKSGGGGGGRRGGGGGGGGRGGGGAQSQVCDESFTIEYVFQNPVTINSIGVLKVLDGRSAKVTITFEDNRTKPVFWARGAGQNGFQAMIFNGMKRAWCVLVEFREGNGAIRYIHYCHNCGDAKKIQDAMNNNNYYPPSNQLSNANQGSVSQFKKNPTRPRTNRLHKSGGCHSSGIPHQVQAFASPGGSVESPPP